VIVKNGIRLSVGWNESAIACTTCSREGREHNSGDYAECHSVHAEMMALIEANGEHLRGAKLYLVCDREVTPLPCPICRRMMAACGVELEEEIRDVRV